MHFFFIWEPCFLNIVRISPASNEPISHSERGLFIQNAMRTCPTVYPQKYAHGFCFAVLCCGYLFTDFPISIRLTSLALWQSNDCPSASKVTLINMDRYFMWIHYERLHNHNKAKHNKTVCIFLGIYCTNTQRIIHVGHSLLSVAFVYYKCCFSSTPVTEWEITGFIKIHINHLIRGFGNE